MILFVERLLETMAVGCAAGRGQVDDLPDVGLLAAVEAAGSRAAVGRRGAIASATLEAGGTARHAARRATPPLLPVVHCPWFRVWLVVHDGQRPGPAGELAGNRDSSDGVPLVAGLKALPA
jgi:hypothetical protein